MKTQEKAHITPGPWEVSSGMVQTASGVPIAYMDREPGNGTLPVERDTNAQAIAAVPDLIAALQRIVETPCDHGPQEFCPRELAQAALTKGVL